MYSEFEFILDSQTTLSGLLAPFCPPILHTPDMQFDIAASYRLLVLVVFAQEELAQNTDCNILPARWGYQGGGS